MVERHRPGVCLGFRSSACACTMLATTAKLSNQATCPSPLLGKGGNWRHSANLVHAHPHPTPTHKCKQTCHTTSTRARTCPSTISQLTRGPLNGGPAPFHAVATGDNPTVRTTTPSSCTAASPAVMAAGTLASGTLRGAVPSAASLVLAPPLAPMPRAARIALLRQAYISSGPNASSISKPSNKKHSTTSGRPGAPTLRGGSAERAAIPYLCQKRHRRRRAR